MKWHLPSSYHTSVDLPSSTYQFPQYIVSTDMRLDIVGWNDDSRELGMLELIISFESVVEHSRARKYQDLVEAGRAVGYRVKLLTLEVGSRGMILDSDHLWSYWEDYEGACV